MINAFSRKDLKPLALQDLIQIIKDNIPKEHWNKPVTMFSDEEGNEELNLAEIQIDPKANTLTLVPARFY